MKYWQKCPICEGTGKTFFGEWKNDGNNNMFFESGPCSTCNGTKMIETPDDGIVPVQPYIPPYQPNTTPYFPPYFSPYINPYPSTNLPYTWLNGTTRTDSPSAITFTVGADVSKEFGGGTYKATYTYQK